MMARMRRIMRKPPRPPITPGRTVLDKAVDEEVGVEAINEVTGAGVVEGAEVEINTADGEGAEISTAEGAEVEVITADGEGAEISTAEGAEVDVSTADGAEVDVSTAEGESVGVRTVEGKVSGSVQ
jgi:hypothetical protein